MGLFIPQFKTQLSQIQKKSKVQTVMGNFFWSRISKGQFHLLYITHGILLAQKAVLFYSVQIYLNQIA
jgi:hypothetical protein